MIAIAIDIRGMVAIRGLLYGRFKHRTLLEAKPFFTELRKGGNNLPKQNIWNWNTTIKDLRHGGLIRANALDEVLLIANYLVFTKIVKYCSKSFSFRHI